MLAINSINKISERFKRRNLSFIFPNIVHFTRIHQAKLFFPIREFR